MPLSGFNRTFMELKPKDNTWESCEDQGFNRTFMELKLGYAVELTERRVGLIVPLWN